MNNTRNTKPMVEASFISVLVCVMIILAISSQGIMEITQFIIAIPITILYVRHNFKITLLSSVVTLLITAIMFNPILAVAATIMFYFMGIALGYCIKNNFSAGKSIAITTIALFIGKIIYGGIYIYGFLGKDIYSLIKQQIDIFRSSFEMNKALISNQDQYNKTLEVIKSIDVNLLLYLLPAGIFILSIIFSYLNYIVTRNIAKKFNIKIKPIPKFSSWYLDAKLAAPIIIFICIGMMLAKKDIVIGNYIYISLFMIFNTIMLVQGISVVTFMLLDRFKMKKELFIFFIILLFITGIIETVSIIGMIDLVIDMRSVDPDSLGSFIRSKIKNKISK